MAGRQPHCCIAVVLRQSRRRRDAGTGAKACRPAAPVRCANTAGMPRVGFPIGFGGGALTRFLGVCRRARHAAARWIPGNRPGFIVGKHLRGAFPDGPRRPKKSRGRREFLVIFRDADCLIEGSGVGVRNGEARFLSPAAVATARTDPSKPGATVRPRAAAAAPSISLGAADLSRYHYLRGIRRTRRTPLEESRRCRC